MQPNRGRHSRQQRSAPIPRSTSGNFNRSSEIKYAPTISQSSFLYTEQYSLSRFLSWPKVLSQGIPVNGHLNTSLGYGLSVSDDSICIWPYVSHSSVSMSFPIPSASNTATGCLVPPVAGFSEPGLVLVEPVSNTVSFWESISDVVADGLFAGKKSCCQKLSFVSGEQVSGICLADHVGVLFWTDIGRIFFVQLYDGNGKPTVSCVPLKQSGILGTIMGFSSNRNLVGVKPCPLVNKNSCIVLSCTGRGSMAFWKLSRNGSCNILSQYDASTLLLSKIRERFPVGRVEVTNFVPISDSACAVVMVFEDNYAICRIVVKNSLPNVTVERICSINGMGKDIALHISQSSDVLWWICEDCITIFDLRIKDEKERKCIYLKNDVKIIASSVVSRSQDGESTQAPGLHIFTNTHGILHVQSGSRSVFESEYEMVKQKLKEAAVFGNYQNTPIDFNIKEILLSQPQLEKAILEVSDSILSSDPLHNSVSGSIPDILGARTIVLSNLSVFSRSLLPSMSFDTKLCLRSDAEKCFSVQKAFVAWEDKAKALKISESSSIWHTTLKSMYKSSVSIHEFVLHRLSDLPEFIRGVQSECAKRLSAGSSFPSVVSAILESNEILIALLASAFLYREEEVEVFDIPTLAFGGSRVWTSSPVVLPSIHGSLEMTRRLLQSGQAETLLIENEQFSAKMELENNIIGLSEICCHMYLEHDRWSKDKNAKSNFYESSKKDWIVPLMEIGRTEKAFEIAEKYRDFDTLLLLCHDGRPKSGDERSRLIRRLNYYFERFGKEFAFVLYQFYIDNMQVGVLIEEFSAYQSYLEEFLNKNGLNSVEWMYYIAKDDYMKASKALSQTESAWSDSVKALCLMMNE